MRKSCLEVEAKLHRCRSQVLMLPASRFLGASGTAHFGFGRLPASAEFFSRASRYLAQCTKTHVVAAGEEKAQHHPSNNELVTVPRKDSSKQRNKLHHRC